MRDDKIETIKHEMQRYNMDLFALTEVRWLDSGDFMSDEFRVIYSGGKVRQCGVALLLDKQTAKNVCRIEAVSDRLLAVRIKGSPVDIVVLVVYMPTTSDYEDKDVEDIYDMIDEELEKGKGNDYHILLGDWNAVVGSSHNTMTLLVSGVSAGKTIEEIC
ncbi:craniofacial development protein 2-like [Strongylocentrotus purpuratus]|uniref:Endonuclease/exonuclease/phosphatase domain-containing protein n=1 Tax=Strongylocentrotus purpuratus TaxID=7668 RepID=A0A7M7LTF4_STRPU|nr:craniofacial development protein 2-like [Strongylocentrotus purpuratus]|eukprot:XP_011674927.1 PREDICTED: craniofacial development protein 2-like [Strongylocentrotus purpuratus]